MAIDYVRNVISSGYNLEKINDNFEKIEVALRDGISRSGNSPNQMEADLDLNGNDLLNVNYVDAKLLTINGEVITTEDMPLVIVTEAIEARDAAVAAKDIAVASATNASNSAGSASSSATNASNSATTAVNAATNVQSILDTLVYTVVATRAELKQVDITQFNTVYLQEAGREGWFNFRTGDYSARVAADSEEGVVIKADAIAATTGAWVREKYFDYDVQQFDSDGIAAVTAIEAIGGGVLRVGGGQAAPTLPTTYSGTVIDFDGPSVDVNFGATSGDENVVAKRAWKMMHTGPHPDEILTGFHIQSAITGSSKNGPASADVGLSISHIKKNAQSGATSGEIDGQYIVVRQGGPTPTSRQTSSDHAGLLIDSASFGNPGHGFIIEGALSNLDSAGNVLYSLQAQVGGIDTNWLGFNSDGTLSGTPLGTRYVFGFNAQMVVGQGDVAYLVEGSANWDSAFRVNATEASAVFDIRNNGEFWQGSGANRIKHAHNAGSAILTTGADITFATFSPASGIIAGDYTNADGLRIQGGALGTFTRLEAIGAGTNINLQTLAKGTGYVMLGRSTNSLGFYGASGAVRQTVSGAKGGNAALGSLIAALAALNLISDTTTA